jgi:hypothetical protein
VGSDVELNQTFNGIGRPGRPPPWLFASTWEEAANAVSRMSQSETRERRRAVLTWWVEIMSTMQTMIATHA